MATSDPEAERQRLAEVYAHQTDEELEQIAAAHSQLTDPAREALRAELSHRGLYTGQLDGPAASTPEELPQFRNLITIRSFWYLAEAELAKGLLQAAGIDCFLFDENIVGLGWYANAVHGVKLRVDARDAEAANRILEESAIEGPTPGDTESSS